MKISDEVFVTAIFGTMITFIVHKVTEKGKLNAIDREFYRNRMIEAHAERNKAQKEAYILQKKLQKHTKKSKKKGRK